MSRSISFPWTVLEPNSMGIGALGPNISVFPVHASISSRQSDSIVTLVHPISERTVKLLVFVGLKCVITNAYRSDYCC